MRQDLLCAANVTQSICGVPTLATAGHCSRRRGAARHTRSDVTRMLVLSLLWCALSAIPANAEEADGSSNSDLFGGLPLVVQFLLLIVLVGFSGIFCGLTLGVMGIDTNSLEIIAEAGQEPDRSYARELLPIRKLGHQSLSTLILGNMLGNVLISQLVADITPAGGSAALISFIIATLVILIFAEVLPMSVCKGPKALEIASAGVPILRAFLVILYPIAKPLGMLLDLITPHDPGQIYDRNELKKLMRVHCEAHGERSGLDMTELKMLIGTMDFHEEVVGHIMTPLDKVFMLEESTPADRTLVERLWKEGKSRVPVYRGNRDTITGLLYVKDLVSMLAFRSTTDNNDPHRLQTYGGGLTVGKLVASNSRELIRIRYSTTLPNVLKMFQSGSLHLLLIEEDAQSHATGVAVNFLGIVTLEDVIEELIKGEIRDEYDDEDGSSMDEEVVVPASDAEEIYSTVVPAPPMYPGSFAVASPCGMLPTRRIVVPRMPPKLPRINFCSFYVTGQPLADGHKWVLADYLQRSIGAFASWRVAHIKLLLDEVGDREVDQVDAVDVPHDLQHEGSLADPSTGNLGNSSNSLSIDAPPSGRVQEGDRPGSLRGEAGHNAVIEQTRPDLVLYAYKRPSNVFTLILHGGVRLLVGDVLFNHECRSFTALGEAALGVCASSASPLPSRMPPSTEFCPDFTAIVSRTSRLLIISQKDFERVENYFKRGGPGRKHHGATEAKSTTGGSMQFEDMRRNEEDLH